MNEQAVGETINETNKDSRRLQILMTKTILFAICLAALTSQIIKASEIVSEDFCFVHENETLSGKLVFPENREVEAVIVIIHGHGQTNVNGGQWSDLRSHFASIGVATVLWDKAGCGKSTGSYNHEQTVYSSAKEAIKAIETVKQHPKLKGKNIGLWGISRAGFIAPLVIRDYPQISFWISVSGTDSKESFGYLLKTNLIIEGYPEDEVEILCEEWMKGNQVYQSGGSWEEFRKVNPRLRNNPFVKEFFGIGDDSDEKAYYENQKEFLSECHMYDEESGLMIYVPEIEEILSSIQCPVLAFFGEKDSQVNWRKTAELYKKTIPSHFLTIKQFPDGNHMIQESVNGGLRETLENVNKWNPCEGYYTTMKKWISSVK